MVQFLRYIFPVSVMSLVLASVLSAETGDAREPDAVMQFEEMTLNNRLRVVQRADAIGGFAVQTMPDATIGRATVLFQGEGVYLIRITAIDEPGDGMIKLYLNDETIDIFGMKQNDSTRVVFSHRCSLKEGDVLGFKVFGDELLDQIELFKEDSN